MNLTSIISVSVAVLGLVFTTIWNIINAKKTTDRDYQNIIQADLQNLCRILKKN